MKFFAVLCLCIAQLISTQADTIGIVYPPQGASTKIVGGQDAEEGQAPYQCSMQMRNSHFCGCSIIGKKWILTAAHCVAGQNAQQVEILVGSNNLNGGQSYLVDRFFRHSEHDRPQFANDIALIRLKTPIVYRDQEVIWIELGNDEIPENTNLTLTGWGKISTAGPIPKKLQIIELNSLSIEKCKSLLGPLLAKHVHEGHICTFNKEGEGACNGDSGGPLIYNDRLVGVVNFGVPCASGKPDVFASVRYYRDWIHSIIANN